jgi:hypothetical protein
MDLAEIIDTKGTQKLEERLVNFSELILSWHQATVFFLLAQPQLEKHLNIRHINSHTIWKVLQELCLTRSGNWLIQKNWFKTIFINVKPLKTIWKMLV